MIPFAIEVQSTPTTVVSKRFDQEDDNRTDNSDDDGDGNDNDNVGSCNEERDNEAERQPEEGIANDNYDNEEEEEEEEVEEEELYEDDDEVDERLIEKSVLIHRDENGFGLRVKGQNPVLVEHVHENGAAWRAGVRQFDRISKVNGLPVSGLDHKDVVLLFKSCTRFVGLTLLSSLPIGGLLKQQQQQQESTTSSDQQQQPASSLIKKTRIGSSTQSSLITWNSFRRRHKLSTGGRLFLEGSPSGAGSTTTLLVGESGPLNKMNQTRHCRSGSSGTQAAVQGARRCESVAMRSTFSRRQQQQQLAERRTSVAGEVTGSDPCLRACAADKRAAVCIDCRTPISQPLKQPQQLLGLYCAQCRVKLAVGGESNSARAGAKSLYSGSLRSVANSASNSTANNLRLQLSGSKLMINQQQATDSIQTAPATPNNDNRLTQPASSQAPAPVQQPQVINKRLEIIKELIDTEKAHTDRLRCLDELFYRPLKTGGYMTSEQLRMVFSCHRTLYKIHRQIYRILLSANYNLYSEPLIGSALLEIFEGDLRRRLERASCTFCAAQSNNVELLNKLTRRDTKVGEFLAQVTSRQMVGRLGIKDLLASCFQRLTKYPLLLENLLKATPKAPPPLNCLQPTNDRIGAAESLGPQDSVYQQTIRDDRLFGEQLLDEKDKNSRRMLAISLAEEREFIERALQQSRQILVRVNDSVKVAMSHNKLKEIWKRTDKYPGVPLIDITKQQVVHEGLLTLRLAKRSFDVYVLLLNDYIIILTREGQDKYRLKFFTPEGKSSSSFVGVGSSSSGTSGQPPLQQSVYSPVFVIDEHLTTRDAATDENGFYLLCKRKDDSRIYEFASRSPAERLKWRDRIQWTIERQMSRGNRRPSSESTLTKSSSELSAKQGFENENQLNISSDAQQSGGSSATAPTSSGNSSKSTLEQPTRSKQIDDSDNNNQTANGNGADKGQPTKIEGTISYVEDDGIVMPSKLESSRAIVDQAIQIRFAFDALRKTVPSN